MHCCKAKHITYCNELYEIISFSILLYDQIGNYHLLKKTVALDSLNQFMLHYTHLLMATFSPVSTLWPRTTEPYVPSPSWLNVMYRFIFIGSWVTHTCMSHWRSTVLALLTSEIWHVLLNNHYNSPLPNDGVFFFFLVAPTFVSLLPFFGA
jgi:hypothetical protein